jgi:hypothetical protein
LAVSRDASKKDAEAPDRASGRSSRTLGWIAIAIGGEAALTAVVTSVMMLHQNDIRNRECDGQKVCSAAGANANAQLSNLGPWNAAAYVVGAVGLGVGAFLLLTNPAEKEGHAEVGISPAGLTLQGAF